MTSQLNVVPSLRALAFNCLAERYRMFENKGREDKLVLMLSKLPVTLIPELMRRKAALDAITAADDIKDVVTHLSERISWPRTTKNTMHQCISCDHEQEVELEFTNDRPVDEEEETLEWITREKAKKKRKLKQHCLQKEIPPTYAWTCGYDTGDNDWPSSPEDKEE